MAQESRDVPIEWHIPENLPTQYATNVIVTHTDNEFIVSFFETFPPLIVGEPDQVQKQVEALESIRARCVARIVVSPSRMEAFIGALVQNFTRFMSDHSAEEQELDGGKE